MPYTVPLLSAWRGQVRNFFAARLSTVQTLRVSAANVLADGMSAVANNVLQYFVNESLNLFLDTMSSDYLYRRGAIYGMAPIQPAQASGNVTFTGTSGYAIPALSVLTAADKVTQITTQAAGTLVSGTVTVAVLAQPGSAGNQAATAPLSLNVAIAGVNPTALVASGGLVGGTDLETDDAFRARVLQRQKYPPSGGAWFDYVAWVKAAGVGATRAWVYYQYAGPGTVGVTFMCDGRSNPIPLSGDVTAVQAFIAGLAPIDTAAITVFSPTAAPVAVTLASLTPNTATTQANILAALQTLFSIQPTPGGATWGDGVDANDPAGFTAMSQISGAVQNSAGVVSFDLSAPSSDITAATGHISTLGTVTY